jgi:filamentous hemagglutinin family protein
MIAAKFDHFPNSRQRTRGMLLGRTALCGVLSLGVVAAFAARPARAEPAGGTVVQGGAAIQTTGSHTEITQTTQQTLITWQDFSIGSAESVNFAQPNTKSVALNKVLTNIPSDIQGQLTANGQVWIINPNGVFVGAGATVNVGGLVATTADLVEQDWDAGKYTFTGAPAGSQVDIAGAVNATDGSIVLVAPLVNASGSLTAAGDVALGAGSGFAVDFHGDGLTRFAVDAAAGARLDVSGTISAQGGAAYLVGAASDAVEDAVVSIGGQVEAIRIEDRGGVIVISGGETGVTEISGTVDASQAEGAGGSVTITGGRIALTGTAVVDASGATDGGTVEIGGGFQGAALASDVVAFSAAPAESPLPTAKRTYVAEGALIAANAGTEGDGGTVIVWSDEITAFHGALSATGGATGGDGGFAEVSGKENLDFHGTFDLSAPAGAAGELLLDPNNITIVAAGANDALLADNQVLFGEPDAVTNISISAGALDSAANITLQANGDIIVDSTVLHFQTGGLIFQADNNVTINQSVLSNGFLDFTANFDSAGGGSIAMAVGTQLFGTDIALAGDLANLRTVTATGGLNISAGDVNLLGGFVTATDGVTITNPGGGIGFGGTAVGGFQITDAEADLIESALTLDAAGNVTVNGISFDQQTTILSTGTVGFLTAASTFDQSLTATGTDFAIGANLTVAGAGGVNLFHTGGASETFGVGGSTTINDVELARVTAGEFGYFNVDGTIHITENLDVSDFDVFTLGARDIDIDSGVTISNSDIDGDDITVGTIAFVNTQNDGVTIGGDDAFVGMSSNLDLDDPGFIVSNDDVAGIDANVFNIVTSGGVATFADASGGGGADPDFSGILELGVTATDIVIPNDVIVDLGTGTFAVTHATPTGNITLGAAGGMSLSDGELDRIQAGTFSATTQQGNIEVVEIEFSDAGEPDTMNLSAPGGLVNFTNQGGGNEQINGLSTINIAASDVDIDPALTIDMGAGGAFSLTNAEGDLVTLGTSSATAGTFDLSAAALNTIDGGTLSVTTAGNIVVDSASADNATNLVLNAGTTIAFSGGISDFDNNLTLNPGGAVTQTAALVVDGTTDINAAGLIVALDHDDNDFGGAVSVEGLTVSLDDTNVITLGDATVTGTLSVEADDGIEQTGAGITVAGGTTLSATGGTADITLNDNGNDFDSDDSGDTVTVLAGRDVSLRDEDSIILGNVAATGDLTVQADGAGTITQALGTAVTAAGGTTDLIATGSAITLANAGNNFLEVDATGGDVTLRDVSGIVLDDVTATGALAVTAGGSITDADGTIDVQGATSLLAFDGVANYFDIVLDNGNHDFDSDGSGDGLTAEGEDITLSENGDLVLGALTLHAGDLLADPTVPGNTGSLSATATGDGDITQGAGFSVFVPGSASFTATGNTITLTETFNDFVGPVNAAATDINLNDFVSITLGDIDATGNLSVTSIFGNIDDGAAGAAGTDVNVAGVTNLTAFGSITLNDGTNDFIGVVNAAGGAVSLSDDNAIVLGDIDAGSLTVVADDSISDGAETVAGGDVNVTGVSNLTAGTTITLDDATNDFGGAVAANGTDIVLTDSNLLTTGLVSASGNVLLTSADLNITAAMTADMVRLVNSTPDALLELGPGLFGAGFTITDAEADLIGGPGALGGHLTLESTGNGQIVVSGVSFNAAADVQNVTLDTTSGTGSIFFTGVNSFEGDLTVNSGNAVQQFTFIGPDSLTVSGALDMNATGFVLVNLTGNDFTGPVDASGTNITLLDANSITLGDIDASGNLTVQAGTFILDSGTAVAGEGLDVGGDTTLTAGAGFNVLVDDAVNSFGGAVSASGANVSLRDAGSLTLGDIDATFSFTAVSGGAIDDGAQAGAGADVNVTGPTTLIAATSITLDDATNDFNGLVNASGTDITLRDANSITLADIEASGTLTVQAAAAIADGAEGDLVAGFGGSSDVDVTGDTTLIAGTSITLDDSTNAFGGAVSAAGTDISLRDSGSIKLADIDASGTLVVDAGGSIDDGDPAGASGDVNVAGNATLTATGDITLDDATNDFAGSVDADSDTGSIVLADANALILGTIDTDDDLTIVTGGSVTDTLGRAISVGGHTSIMAGGPDNFFDVVLDNPGTPTAIDDTGFLPGPAIHDFNTIDVTGEDILIRDRNAITVKASGNSDGAPDPTLNASYNVAINTGVTVQTATISPNGSVVILSGVDPLANEGNLTVNQVTAAQEILLATPHDIVLLPDGEGGAAHGGVPLHSDNGDIWLVALNGGFEYFDLENLADVYAGASNPGAVAALPGAGDLIPAGTMFDAPEGNIAIIVRDAFKVVVTEGNVPLNDPQAPAEPADPVLPADYVNNAFVLNTARDGVALISVKDGEIAVGSVPIIEGVLTEQGEFEALGAIGTLSSSFQDLFVATGNLALESRNTAEPASPSDPAVSFFVENTSSSIGAGSGTRVIGATFLAGFWENIGVFGSFNGIPGQTAAILGFITDLGQVPRGGRVLAVSPEAGQIIQSLGRFVINPRNTANGCIIGLLSSCQPIGRVILLLEVEDGSLLAFRFQDDEEEEDDPFSNRGDEEDWQ